MFATRSPHNLLLAISLTLTLCSAIGCSSGTTVSGQVTVDGEPLDEGIITFKSVEPNPKIRGIQTEVSNGRFTVTSAEGLPEGSYKVAITARRNTGRQIPVEEGSPEMEEETEQYIPPSYNIQTNLSADISANSGGLLFEIELPKQKKKRR